MDFKRFNTKYVFIACLVISALSCEKQEVNFGGGSLTQDPNITIVDTISVNAYTTQRDSFSTLSSGYFIAGTHQDNALGNFQSVAYFDLNVPYDSSSTLKDCTGCYFDSLVIAPKFSGGYYGDTSKPFTLNVNQLSQVMTYDAFGYNIHSIPYNTEPLASFSATVSPSKQSAIRIKLPDDMGKDLFNKIQRNSDTITSNDNFLNYIKGFCFTTAPGNDVVYHMKTVSDSSFISLYYHKNDPLPAGYVVKFPLNTTHQFNQFITDYTGTNLTVFKPKKQLTVNSSETAGYVYMDGSRGLYPKINFPSLYSLHELNNYVRVISATLEIYPVKGSYGAGTFYTLPREINAYLMNQYDIVQGYLTDATGNLQTGNLSIDYEYGENTKYSFDVTSYVNTCLSQGVSSSLYLYFQLPSGAADATSQRLILQALNNNSFKLKLNVLGL